MAIGTKKAMNKKVYLGLSFLDLNEINSNAQVLVWLHQKILKKEKLDFYEYIEDDVEVRFGTLNYKFERPLPAGKWKRFWYYARWIRKRYNKNFYRVKIKKVLLYI